MSTGTVADLQRDDVFYFGDIRYEVFSVVTASALKSVKIWFKASNTESNQEKGVDGALRVMHLPADIPFEFFRHGKDEVHLHIEMYPQASRARRYGKSEWLSMMMKLYPSAKVIWPKTPGEERKPLLGELTSHISHKDLKQLGVTDIPEVRRPWITSCGDDTREEF